jgi:hypothetical protein
MRACIMEARAARLRWLLACWRACFAIALPPTWCWLAEHELMLIAPPEKHVLAQREASVRHGVSDRGEVAVGAGRAPIPCL